MGRMDQLLERDQWGEYTALMCDLRHWAMWPLFSDALKLLNRKALYQSRIHGEGHIERTMLFGTLTARDEQLEEADAQLLLEACSYHDVGRVDDSLDDDHGRRSALRLAELTGRSGEELKLLMAAVEAHSRDDRDMGEIIRSYHPADERRARRLAEMLKDSDGLDRVRIHEALDPAYLRRRGSRWYIPFSEYLFSRYGGPKVQF